MFSRAHLLIERDFERLQKDNPWGVEAHPLKEGSMFEWTAKILGLKGSLWEGGVFRLYLKFDEHYNTRPPQVCFHTIPFHPNVDMITGKPCIDFLDDWTSWKSTFDLGYILMAVQLMLSNPVLDGAVNLEAVQMMKYSPHAYRQMVQDCVAASQRVEAGFSPHPGEEKVRFGPQKNEEPRKISPKTAPHRKAKLSFEDYHTTWSGIATSKHRNDLKNPLHEAIKDNPNLQAAHYGIPVDELQNQMQRQLDEHNTLMYGKVQPKPTETEVKQAKLDKVQKMRKIYLQPRTPRKQAVQVDEQFYQQQEDGGKENTEQGGKGDEPWDHEVDDLVAWTHKLDEETL